MSYVGLVDRVILAYWDILAYCCFNGSMKMVNKDGESGQPYLVPQ